MSVTVVKIEEVLCSELSMQFLNLISIIQSQEEIDRRLYNELTESYIFVSVDIVMGRVRLMNQEPRVIADFDEQKALNYILDHRAWFKKVENEYLKRGKFNDCYYINYPLKYEDDKPQYVLNIIHKLRAEVNQSNYFISGNGMDHWDGIDYIEFDEQTKRIHNFSKNHEEDYYLCGTGEIYKQYTKKARYKKRRR